MSLGFQSEETYNKYIIKMNHILGIFNYFVAVFLLILSIISHYGIYPYPEKYLWLGFFLEVINIFLYWIFDYKKYNPHALKYYSAVIGQIIIFHLSLDYHIQLTTSYFFCGILSLIYFSSKYTIFTCALTFIFQIGSSIASANNFVDNLWTMYTVPMYLRRFVVSRIIEAFYTSVILIFASFVTRGMVDLIQKKNDEINKFHSNLVYSFADLIESRDGTTGEHVKRSSSTLGILVDYVKENKIYGDKVSDQYYEYTKMAAPLHDIGKMKVPDFILSKPGPLTKEEYEVIKTHVDAGYSIIEDTLSKIEKREFIEVAKEIALYHHERWDGKGYPKGLKEEEIPVSARLMAIADVFDALCSKRSYKEAYSIEDSYKILVRNHSDYFEPQLLEIFIELRPRIEKNYIKQA